MIGAARRIPIVESIRSDRRFRATAMGGLVDDILSFDFTTDGTLLLDNLTSTSRRTRISLQPGIDLDLLQLTSVDEFIHDLPAGSSLNAPNLVEYTSSEIDLDPLWSSGTSSLWIESAK